MFKGKKSIYILLPLNIFIWGYMGYKVYSAFNDDEKKTLGETSAPRIKLNTSDTAAYQLNLNYKDPFLKEEPSRARDGGSLPRNPVPQLTRPLRADVLKEEKRTPEIKYLGLIENKTSGAAAAMITVNGNSQVIRQGQLMNEIAFQTVTSEFIIVKIGKEQITIKR